jgi:SRSO17 transposase
MTEQEITDLGPAFAAYLRRFRGSLGQDRTAGHFGTYCRGLLCDLPRKSVEPIALAAGTAGRTLQEFLAAARWDHDGARDTLQAHLGQVVAGFPADPLGTIGVIDETSCRKWGGHTPGVQRQYLGCVGKLDNGIVTVHVGVVRGTFQTLLDAELYLPKAWDADRKRCRAAGIPDAVRYRPKWRIALDQLARLERAGVRPDWLVFDEGYGAAVPMLRILNLAGRKFVGEVPVNFSVRDEAGSRSRRADARLTTADARGGSRHRIVHRTVGASYWRAATARVWAENTPWWRPSTRRRPR